MGCICRFFTVTTVDKGAWKGIHMNVWNDLLGNQLLISAVVGWVVAQFLKTLIDFALNKNFNAER